MYVISSYIICTAAGDVVFKKRFGGRASIEACDVSPGTSIDGVQSLTSLLCLLSDTLYEINTS